MFSFDAPLKNVLIVDDLKVIRSILKKEISRCSDIQANLIMAESYAETIELVEMHEFHVAILDVNLPDAPKGEVIDLLRSKNVPVVVLTGGINEMGKKLILEKDIVEYVTKNNPKSISYILSVIKRILNNYSLHVLIVDDSKSFRQVIRKNLEKAHVNVLEAASAEEAIDIIDESDKYIPLVLTDYEMPGMSGMDLTIHLRQVYSKDRLSIIAISGADKQNISTQFLRYGANDFIKKPFTDEELSARINLNLEMIELFKMSKENASKDFLTGLYNRRFFFESGNPIVDKAKRKGLPIAVAMIDIDLFKIINDTYGHDVGDIAIKEVGVILNRCLRRSDLIARFGGEEFCILMDNTLAKNVEIKFELIREAFEKNVIKIDGLDISYTVSIGINYGTNYSLDDMIKLADKALYMAKDQGRNSVVITTQ